MKRISKTSRDLQAEERKKQILQGAKELFALHGFHGTSVRTINKHVGITDGLLYHYFPGGKQEILETIFHESQEERMASMDRLIASIHPGLPLEEGLYLFISGMVKTMTGDKDFIQIMFRDSATILSDQKDFMSEMIEQRQQALAEILEKRGKSGEIREMDYTLAAHQIMSVGITTIFKEVSFIKVVQMDLETYLRKMVHFTVDLWRP